MKPFWLGLWGLGGVGDGWGGGGDEASCMKYFWLGWHPFDSKVEEGEIEWVTNGRQIPCPICVAEVSDLCLGLLRSKRVPQTNRTPQPYKSDRVFGTHSVPNLIYLAPI